MAYVDNGKVTGRVNRTEVATPTVSFNVDNGYFTVTQNQPAGLVAQDIKKAGYQLPTLSGSAVTPSNQDQIAVRKGNYIGGDITVKGDANLKSEYILRGRRINGEETPISIFGVQGTLERLRNLPKYHDEEIYGQLASDCAKSYHIARCVLGVEFKYSQSHGIFGDGVLTDSEGRCYMDCSTLGGLVARNIPFNKSPKILFTSNYILSGTGDSHDARKIEIELFRYYSKKYRPINEFGKRFFNDWSKKEWNCFFNYMIIMYYREGFF